jgi:hypothetical protein
MIHGYNGITVEVGADYAALVVVFLYAHAVFHVLGFYFGNDARARIALFLRRKPIALVAEPFELHFVYLFGLRLGLLDAEDVWLFLFEPVVKALGNCGADSIDVV